MSKKHRYLQIVVKLTLVLATSAACSQRQRVEYCNLSDVLTCSVNFSAVDDVRACVTELGGTACELSDAALAEIEASQSLSDELYTCNTIEEIADEVEARGFSLSHVPATDRGTLYVDPLRELLSDFESYAVTRSIQEAIDLAGAGDLIVVCPGQYYENLVIAGANKDGVAIVNLIGGDIDLTDLTVVEPLTGDSVLKVSDALGVTVSGLTLQGGSADYGGGVHVGLFRSDAGYNDGLILSNSVVQDNTAVIAGGGIFIEGWGDVRGSRMTLTRNTAGLGGAIALATSDAGKRIYLSDSTIEENKAALVGPAIYADGADYVIVAGGTISLNDGYIAGVDLPAVHLADAARFYAGSVDFGEGLLDNPAGDVFNAARFELALADFGWEGGTLDWGDGLDAILAADAVADAGGWDEALAEAAWVYDYEGTATVSCNLSTSSGQCVGE